MTFPDTSSTLDVDDLTEGDEFIPRRAVLGHAANATEASVTSEASSTHDGDGYDEPVINAFVPQLAVIDVTQIPREASPSVDEDVDEQSVVNEFVPRLAVVDNTPLERGMESDEVGPSLASNQAPYGPRMELHHALGGAAVRRSEASRVARKPRGSIMSRKRPVEDPAVSRAVRTRSDRDVQASSNQQDTSSSDDTDIEDLVRRRLHARRSGGGQASRHEDDQDNIENTVETTTETPTSSQEVPLMEEIAVQPNDDDDFPLPDEDEFSETATNEERSDTSAPAIGLNALEIPKLRVYELPKEPNDHVAEVKGFIQTDIDSIACHSPKLPVIMATFAQVTGSSVIVDCTINPTIANKSGRISIKMGAALRSGSLGLERRSRKVKLAKLPNLRLCEVDAQGVKYQVHMYLLLPDVVPRTSYFTNNWLAVVNMLRLSSAKFFAESNTWRTWVKKKKPESHLSRSILGEIQAISRSAVKRGNNDDLRRDTAILTPLAAVLYWQVFDEVWEDIARSYDKVERVLRRPIRIFRDHSLEHITGLPNEQASHLSEYTLGQFAAFMRCYRWFTVEGIGVKKKFVERIPIPVNLIDDAQCREVMIKSAREVFKKYRATFSKMYNCFYKGSPAFRQSRGAGGSTLHTAGMCVLEPITEENRFAHGDTACYWHVDVAHEIMLDGYGKGLALFPHGPNSRETIRKALSCVYSDTLHMNDGKSTHAQDRHNTVLLTCNSHLLSGTP